MSVSIREILQDNVNVGNLVAGHEGIFRIVKSVNIMDAPDISNWVQQNQLLLTTGYVIKDDIRAQKKLITDLARQECAGIGIKTKRFIMEIPPDIRELADDLHFPIIELPLHLSLADIMNNIFKMITHTHHADLEHNLEIHHQISQQILNGSDMTAIARTLGEWLHCNVVLLDYRCRVMASSNQFHKRKPLLIEKMQQLAAEITDEHIAKQKLHCYGDSTQISIFPVHFRKTIRGYIILTDRDELDVCQHAVLEQVSTLLTFEHLKKQAVIENERQKQLKFFMGILEQPSISPNEKWLAKMFGLIDAPYKCVVIQTYQRSLGQERRNLIHDQIELHTGTAFPNTVILNTGKLFILLIPCPKQLTSSEEMQSELQFEQKMAELAEWLEQNHSVPFHFGVGGPYPRMEDSPKSYREACQALETGYESSLSPKIRYYKTQEIIELLRYIPHSKIEDLYTRTLGKLHVFKDAERDDMILTLYHYLENNCNIAETAKNLYVHRNTVLYRIEKCEELMECRLKNPEQNLLLRIVLRAAPLLGSSERKAMQYGRRHDA